MQTARTVKEYRNLVQFATSAYFDTRGGVCQRALCNRPPKGLMFQMLRTPRGSEALGNEGAFDWP